MEEGGRKIGGRKMIAEAKRKRRVSGVLKSREEVETSLGEYARLTIERDALTVDMEERIRLVRAQFEERLAEANADAETEFELIADWAARNPGEFEKRKSLELTHGTIGFRTGMPKLKTLRGWTWDRVLEALAVKRMTRYLREVVSVKKDLLLDERERIGEEGLKEIGLKAVQDETFFVEAKREEAAAA